MVEPGRRERKKQETRRALASAALRLVVDRGPDAVTVEAISAAADVSLRTFFNYFRSKEDAILDVDLHETSRLHSSLAERPPEEAPLEALHRACRDAAAGLEADADDWALRVQLVQDHPVLYPRYVGRFVDLERRLVLAVAARLGVEPDADPYPALVVAVAMAALRISVTRWREAERTVPLVEVIDESFARLAAGLIAPVPSNA